MLEAAHGPKDMCASANPLLEAARVSAKEAARAKFAAAHVFAILAAMLVIKAIKTVDIALRKKKIDPPQYKSALNFNRP